MSLSLQAKLTTHERGVYLFGTTPPKCETTRDEAIHIARTLINRTQHLGCDGYVVYDLQDESARNQNPRPFAFKSTLDARLYAGLIKRLSGHDTITYKSVSGESEASLKTWLAQCKLHDHVVMVGSPTKQAAQLPLSSAYELSQAQQKRLHVGGVTIAERHQQKHNEHERLLHKETQGCDYFISQAIYDPQASIDLITRYARECKATGKTPKRIILTFAPCGSEKTLDFLAWLGVAIPEASRYRLLDAPDCLNASIALCKENLDSILRATAHLGVPLGLNIESVSNRKVEIDGAVNLFRLLKATLELSLAEQAVLTNHTLSAPHSNEQYRPVPQHATYYAELGAAMG